ncbi:MAG: IPT/TIG domain-containing protein [Planctomycetota bacterium]|jgi:hypothetical protein
MSRISLLLVVAFLFTLATPAAAAENRGVPLNLGDRVTSRISPPEDVDTFVFDAFAGSRLSLLLAPVKGDEAELVMEILDPSGAVLDPGDRLKTRGAKIRVKRLLLAETGRYAVRVWNESGLQGAGGEFVLKTKGKLAKSCREDVVLAAGAVLDFTFGAKSETRVSARVRTKGGEEFQVTSVFDPAGEEVADATFEFSKKGARATFLASSGSGDYGFTIQNGTAEASLTVKVRCRHPKVKKQRREISPAEPVVEEIDPDTAAPGDTVTIRGRNFRQGQPLVLFGETPSPSATRGSTTEITARVPSGTGTVAVTVFNPDGQEGTLADAFTFDAAQSNSISGTVSGDVVSGVQIQLSGDHAASTATGGGGAYVFEGIADGSYTVTPSHPDTDFDPPSRDVDVAGADVAGVDFTSVRNDPDPEVNTNPPASPVRLVFVHHSVGENWLAADNGALGSELGDNNYCVRDTNYGWEAPENEGIGSFTDIGHWYTWFADTEVQGNGTARRDNITGELYDTETILADYVPISDPGGENDIVMFKSCYPNSEVRDDNSTSPEDLFGRDCERSAHTLGNCKEVYREILEYFETRTDKMFVVITAPPISELAGDADTAANARALNDWLVNDWLADADWENKNVYVFDFFNVLTDPDNHHRVHLGEIQHENSHGDDHAHYVPGWNSHPTEEGNQKATAEYVPLLNVFYHRWQAYLGNE